MKASLAERWTWRVERVPLGTKHRIPRKLTYSDGTQGTSLTTEAITTAHFIDTGSGTMELIGATDELAQMIVDAVNATADRDSADR